MNAHLLVVMTNVVDVDADVSCSLLLLLLGLDVVS